MRRLTIAVLLLAVAAGCQRPGEQRAERDARIGRGAAGGVAFRSAGGLAHVRAISAGSLELWAQAPTIELAWSSSPGATEAWTITLSNAMPDAELVDPEGAVTAEREQLLPTRLRWTVSLPAGQSGVLRIATPDAGGTEAFRFAVLADVQDALPDVGDIYRRMAQDPSLRFVVFAGDLTENGSASQLTDFQRRLEALPIPVFATLGNHELFTDGDAPPFQDLFGRASLHFAFRGVHFTLLDSGDAAVDPLALEWLDGWLEEARGAVHVVAMHIAPFEPTGTRNGSFGSRNEAAAIVARMAEAKVDLTLYGHVHSYYAFENAGIPAYISGGGGAIPERFDGVGRHYLVVTATPERIEDVALVRVD